MATGKIGKRTVDAMDATGEKQFLWDSDLRGFGLQVTPAGAKSYIYQYRMGGREAAKRRYTIGRHGSPWTPTSARDECERLALLVAQGVDPLDQARERRREAVDLAFAAYVDTFVSSYLKSRWKDWVGAERMLKREPVEMLRNKPLPQIERADIVAILDRLADKPAVARLTFAVLRKLFKWAEGRGEIERSPIGPGFPAPKAVEARDRTLSDSELALAWEAADKLQYPFGPMYQLLFVFGARRDEVSGIDWVELDRKAREWTLPGARAKNGKPLIVHLSDLAVEILDSIALEDDPPSDKEPEWPVKGLVFSTTGIGSVSGYSRAKKRLDAAMSEIAAKRATEAGIEPSEIEPWRIHDIRRTVATGLQRLGVRFEVTEAVLNHISGSRSGVAGVYQRHDWKEEKRSALDAWARHIRSVLTVEDDRNVLRFERRASK
jgi:integrase